MSALTVEAATARMLAAAAPLEAETIAVGQALGRTLAAPLTARLTAPPFDASAMDGYAARREDVTRLPAELRVIGEAAAGSLFAGVVGPGEAVRIFTGAPVPAGADVIVIQENTRTDPADRMRVTVVDGRADRDHIRTRGFDFEAGALLLSAGRRLGPREVTLAAAAGAGHIQTVRRPRVGVLATGDELVAPGETPGAAQIVASNHLGVMALAERAGASVAFLGIARDTPESLDLALAGTRDLDVLVTIGGASVGDHDLVAPALARRGMVPEFWRIAMRPGKPLMFGRIGPTLVLGLPGNPVSALTCAVLFLAPLVRALQGDPSPVPVPITGETATPLPENGPRAHYMRATTRRGDSGVLRATPIRSQDSSLLSPLAEADVLLVRPIDAPALPAGAAVPLLTLDF